jgi:putative membrane protein
MFSGLFGLAIVVNLLFWGGLIWLAVWAVRRFTDPTKKALAVLEERFARGEIDETEFAARRATLLTRGGGTYP